MAKGIIVVDVTEKCSECVFSNPDGDYCPFHGAVSYEEYDSRKPDWCPIRPLPCKKEVLRQPHSMADFERKGFQRGYNACIDEILKERNK